MLSVIDNVVGLAEVEKLWMALESANLARYIFQTYSWSCLSWKTYGQELSCNTLYVLVWMQVPTNLNDAVIFPFYLDDKGCLRFIMDEHSDYCDCVYVPGRNHHMAFKEALEFISADRRVKQICLHKMDGNSEILNYFAALAPQSSIFLENTYSWIEVAPSDDFAASQPQLRSKDKANIRAIRRKSNRFVLDIVNGGGRYPSQDIDALVEAMRQSGRRGKDFMPDSLKEFCRLLFESGMVDIARLCDAKTRKVVALNFILRMDGRRLSWIFLYTDPHASTELYVKYFYSDAVDESFVFNFGTGGYEYKLGTFRPQTRALFGFNLALDRRLAFWLSFRGLVRSSKNCVKAFLAYLANGRGKGHSVREQPPQHFGVGVKSRREGDKAGSPS